jgi:type I restriction enzyme S subunit
MGGEGSRNSATLYSPAFHFDRQQMPLFDLAEWENGLAFKDIDFGPVGWPVVKIAEVKNGITAETKRTTGTYDLRVRLGDGDLLFCWSGQPESSIGTYRWFRGEAWLNQHIFKVTPKSLVTFDFLHCLLRYLQPNFIELARNKQTTGLGHVTKADLRELLVQVPLLDEQRRIVEIITPLDDKIELNRRMAQTLEAMARALFKSWFVDFDPVRNKAEGQPTGLSDDLIALFPDSLGEGGLPEGWRLGSLRDLARLNPETWTNSTRPAVLNYVDLTNTKWGAIEAVQVVTKSQAPSRAQRVLRPGDTIVGTVRPANGSFAYITREDLTGSTGFAVLRPLSCRRRAAVYFAATAPKNIEALASLADGAAYPAVRPEAVIESDVVLPSPAVLDAFDAAVAPLLASAYASADQSHTLAALRDTLLPKLVSGELRVTDAENRIVAA